MKMVVSGNRWQAVKQRFNGDLEEYSKIVLLFGYLFFVVSASTIGRTAADTLFLSHFSASKISLMYLPQSVTLILVGLLFQRYSNKMRIDRLCFLIIAAVSTLALGSRLLVGFGFLWVYPVIYVAYDVFNFLMIVCFWQFATTVMDQRKAKKLINWVGSGGIVGGIVSGFGLKLLVKPLGTMNLIFIYSALQLLCLVIIYMLIKRISDPEGTFSASKEAAQKPVNERKRAIQNTNSPGTGGLFRNVPHLRYFAVISAALVISLTLIDYQFKVILRGSLQNDALAGFMGSFYGYAGILALLVQFFVTGRVISKFGVMTALILFPVSLFAGSFAVLLSPVLALAVIVKGSDKVLGDTINSSVGQLVMFPIPPEFRGRAKGFLDGIVRNGAKGIAAISLIVLSPLLTIQQFSYIILALLACCLFAVIRIKGAYMRMLLSTLQKRDIDLEGLELDLMDSASLRALTDALQSTEKLQVLYALRILQGLNNYDLSPYISGLLQHHSMEVQIEALKIVQKTAHLGHKYDLEKSLNSPDSSVKSHAILALAAYADDDQLDLLTSHLEDDKVDVRAAAIAGLIKYYAIEGMFRAVGMLKQLIESEQEDDRVSMASIFGQIGLSGFYKPLIPLLSDKSPLVRLRALESAAILRLPELVPHIVPLLQRSETRQSVIETLSGYEEHVIEPLLEPYLEISAASLHLPKVFERINSQRAFNTLLREYGRASQEFRAYILDALTHMRYSGRQADPKAVEKLIVQETELYRYLASLGEGFNRILLFSDIVEAIHQIRKNAVYRIFQLLALVYDPKTVNAVFTGWTNGDTRRQANAAEVIDQLLRGDLRTLFTEIMTPLRNVHVPSDTRTQDNQLRQLYDQEDVWLKQCVTFVVAGSQDQRKWPVITEFLMSATEEEERGRIAKQVELVRMLRKVTLFAGLPGKDLTAIANHLTEVFYITGKTIIRDKEEGDSFYLIQEGIAGIYRNDLKIGEIHLGDCFGEMSVLTESVRTATVVAETDMLLWRLDSTAFYEMVFDKTEIALEMMKLLSRRLRRAILQYEEASRLRSNGTIPLAETEAATALSVSPPAQAAAISEIQETALSAMDISQEQLDSKIILRRILILQKIGLFSRFSQDDFVHLAKMVEEVVYEPGEPICVMGEDGDEMHGIIEGSVRVHKGTETLATLNSGECFGEMAIIDGEPRSADCTAITRTVLLQLRRELVFSFCFQRIEVMKSMMRVLAERLNNIQ